MLFHLLISWVKWNISSQNLVQNVFFFNWDGEVTKIWHRKMHGHIKKNHQLKQLYSWESISSFTKFSIEEKEERERPRKKFFFLALLLIEEEGSPNKNGDHAMIMTWCVGTKNGHHLAVALGWSESMPCFEN